jgi:LysR family transcriptional regulator, glycine cleavage system transcriptional activator
MQLPNLQAVQSFEAAARHQSFSRAADELGVTHGAVSHHIRNLEERLRIKLFERSGRGVVLTENGQALSLKVRQGLSLIQQAFEEVHQRKAWRTLTVSVLPAFASRWLIPRLGDFERSHKGRQAMDINLRATQEVVDLARDGIDLAIRYGAGNWPGSKSLKLRDEVLFPVCSRELNGGRLPATVQEIAKGPLLRHTRQPWTPWFRAAGLKRGEPARGLSFNEAGGLLQAAGEGHGIALARRTLVDEDLRTGRLVRLSSIEVVDTYAWYAVWREQGSRLQEVAVFCDWLQEQFAMQ